MRFEWDDAKRRANIQKHGFDFYRCGGDVQGILLVSPEVRDDYGESRWVGLGFIRGCTVKVVFSEREPDFIRVISLRKATRRESEEFEKAINDRLETN
jgi:uncharacterized DUF497 family protein